MIYTIGYTKSYLKYFEEQETPKKMGRTKDYPGGSVWKTKKEAQQNCKEGYSVFGVLADWNKDTEPNENESFNNLLIDAELVQL